MTGDVGDRDGAHGHDEDDLLRVENEANLVEHRPRTGKSLEIDDERARLHRVAPRQSRDGPGIDGEDLESRLEELRPQKRAFGPSGTEHHDVWTRGIHGSSPVRIEGAE